MDSILIIGIGVGAALFSVGLYLLYRATQRPRGLRRPDWDKLCADTDYFRKALHHIFTAQGYKVTGYSIVKDKTEREPMTVVFALRKNGTLYCAFCVRWFLPVTSNTIEDFEKALTHTRASKGFIVTAGTYSPAAIHRALKSPVTLFNRDDLKKWIETIWPK